MSRRGRGARSGRPGDVAQADQQRAAEDHSARFFDRHRQGFPGGGTRVELPPDTTPAWLRTLLDLHQAALNGPDAKACDHVADHQAIARTVFAWYPGLIVCVQCAASGRFMPKPGSDDEFTCDGCGELHREGLRPSVIQIMPDTTFHLGVCGTCLVTLNPAGA